MLLELRRLLAAYDATDFTQRQGALVTVVRVAGSAYRRPGARLFMTDDGRWTGAISGGCLEGDALRKARQAILARQPRLVTYDTMDDESSAKLGIGLGCNGVIDVLIEPLDPARPDNPLALLRGCLGLKQPVAVATVFATPQPERLPLGARLMLNASGQSFDFEPNNWLKQLAASPAEAALQAGKSAVLDLAWPTNDGLSCQVFVEVLLPPPQLFIFGGGPDVVPLVAQAKGLGWQVTVTDDCLAHLSPKRFAEADELVAVPRQEAASLVRARLQIGAGGRTAALLMSHSYNYDLAVLRQLLPTPLHYLGVMGPRNRGEKMLAELARQGETYTEAQLARLHYPVGLDLGAETPEEIALAIVAELLASFNDRDGAFLKHRASPIHERA
ncbi:MAG: XdhC family protein [Bernardetiaceae bacterium]|jgi:xanthine/CO dehydrogenase XdhC/CoxF family maturation factor|nr:XdhC family protein [Bernardetiaceae bacterium]